MKPGDLVTTTFLITKIFESLGGEFTVEMKPGDHAVLLKQEKDCYGSPCWQVLYNGQVGLVASKWLQPVKDERQTIEYPQQ